MGAHLPCTLLTVFICAVSKYGNEVEELVEHCVPQVHVGCNVFIRDIDKCMDTKPLDASTLSESYQG